jgi:membrane protein implicated in regulation of membrane protease activity
MENEFFMRPDLFWFILGLAFFLLELIIPGFVIFFFGIGAWVTSLVCLIWEPGLDLMLIIFFVTSVVSLILLRRFFKRKFFRENDGSPSTLKDEFVGREAVALEDIPDGKRGRIEFKGAPWTAIATGDIKKNDAVIITEKESINLIVKLKK